MRQITDTNKQFFDNSIAGVWTVKEVASYLRCSVGHIYNLVSQKKIPNRKRGRMLRFIPEEIYNWVYEGV